jgi:hypothetical protein
MAESGSSGTGGRMQVRKDVVGNVHYFVAEDTTDEDTVYTETWYDIYTRVAGA